MGEEDRRDVSDGLSHRDGYYPSRPILDYGSRVYNDPQGHLDFDIPGVVKTQGHLFGDGTDKER